MNLPRTLCTLTLLAIAMSPALAADTPRTGALPTPVAISAPRSAAAFGSLRWM